MKKLNKRQIIILAVAALFVLYAVYELFLAGPAAKKPQARDGTAPVDTFVDPEKLIFAALLCYI